MAEPNRYPFEKEIYEMEELLAGVEARAGESFAISEEVRRIRRELVNLKRQKYASLAPWETVQFSRDANRPQTMDYVELIFEDWVELHGDRAWGDDRAIRCGFARLGDFRVMLIGHQKGHTTQERLACMFGCAHPEGYRKALKNMRLAAKYRLPIICLIDTPGAFPGIGAEERGQAPIIAANLLEMTRLETPVICVIIGEGGSGGALGIGIGDRVSMLEHAYYSVISPEGCAGILWKTANETTIPLAANALQLRARDLAKLGVIDEVIPEPLGGAHRDPQEMANTLKGYLVRYLRELKPQTLVELVEGRYQKFRRMGVYLDGVPGSQGNDQSPPASATS